MPGVHTGSGFSAVGSPANAGVATGASHLTRDPTRVSTGARQHCSPQRSVCVSEHDGAFCHAPRCWGAVRNRASPTSPSRSPMTPRIRPVLDSRTARCDCRSCSWFRLLRSRVATSNRRLRALGRGAPGDGPSGKQVPYRPSGAHRCGIDKVRHAGPGSVLGLYVERARCRGATRLVRAYQSCLDEWTAVLGVLRPRLPPRRPACVPGALPHP